MMKHIIPISIQYNSNYNYDKKNIIISKTILKIISKIISKTISKIISKMNKSRYPEKDLLKIS